MSDHPPERGIRKPRPTCILADGRHVKFALKRRDGEPHYFVVFPHPTNRRNRLERSTKETNQKRAEVAAAQIIKEEYGPKTSTRAVTWDQAVAELGERMHANNNRERTIEDYLDTITVLRAVYPTSRGPADITLEQAKAFKSSYQAQGYVRQKKSEPKIWKGRGRKPKARPEPVAHARAARTVDSRLRKLRSLWGRWFIQELGYVTANPWQGVTAPKLDKLTPRYLSAEEVAAFFAWLAQRWQGWRLPALFCEVKSFLGNRILELCSLTTDQLQAGRVVFAADGTKGRKERQAVLPPEVYAELKASAGPAYVWEKFPEQLRERLQALHRPHHKVLPDFSPARLKGWIQDEIDDYCKAHPEVKRFSAHGFRKRAMTQAWRLKIRPEEAAVAFGCNPRTMMAHYVSMDEVATADAVLKAVAEALDPRARERVQEATPDRPDGTGE